MVQLLNLSELSPDWHWLRDSFAHDIPDWHHVSSLAMPRRWPLLGAREARWRAVSAARAQLRTHDGAKILVSHGPRPAAYWGCMAGANEVDAHIVYSFNFTDLPTGLERVAMRRGFRHVTRFVVASQWERHLYADYFDIPESRIEFRHWGVRPPEDGEASVPAKVQGSYVCALGSQARDYRCLFESMRLVPEIPLVLVATPESVRGLTLPGNARLLTQIPFDHAMNVLRHSRLMVLPLNDAHARCGHVTAVAALHRGIPTVATQCRGLDDYLLPGVTATVVPPHDPDAMASAIRHLFSEDALRQRLSHEGRQLAMQRCTEEAVVTNFREWLNSAGLLA